MTLGFFFFSMTLVMFLLLVTEMMEAVGLLPHLVFLGELGRELSKVSVWKAWGPELCRNPHRLPE